MTREYVDYILHVAAQAGTISFILGANKRWHLYFTVVKQVLKIVLMFVAGFVRRLGRRKAP